MSEIPAFDRDNTIINTFEWKPCRSCKNTDHSVHQILDSFFYICKQCDRTTRLTQCQHQNYLNSNINI